MHNLSDTHSHPRLAGLPFPLSCLPILPTCMYMYNISPPMFLYSLLLLSPSVYHTRISLFIGTRSLHLPILPTCMYMYNISPPMFLYSLLLLSPSVYHTRISLFIGTRSLHLLRHMFIFLYLRHSFPPILFT